MADIIARPSSKPTPAEVRRAKRGARFRAADARVRAFSGFYFNSFSRAFLRAWLWALAVSGAITFLVPAVLYLSGVGLTFSQEDTINHLYIQIPLLFFIVLLAMMLFYVPFVKYETLRNSHETLKRQFKRKLKILYEPGMFDHVVKFGNDTRFQVIRFGIKNDSAEIVDGVKVKVEKFLNFGDTAIYNVPLRITHDHSHKKSNGFSINPGDTELVDLVQKDSGSNDLFLTNGFSAEAKVPTVTHDKELALRVLITASVGLARERQFHVVVDEKGVMHCR